MFGGAQESPPVHFYTRKFAARPVISNFRVFDTVLPTTEIWSQPFSSGDRWPGDRPTKGFGEFLQSQR